MKTMRTTLSAALMAFGAAAATTAANATELHLGTYVTTADIRYKGLEKFADLVKQKTDGRVTFKLFPSSTLAPLPKAWDAVTAGLADAAATPLVDARVSCYRKVFFAPTPIDYSKHVEFDRKLMALIGKQFEEAGAVVLMSSNFSYDQEWFFREPIEKLDQLEERLVRSVSPIVTRTIELWGGSPVFIPPAETYQAAERGVVDSINMGVATSSSLGLFEVLPYMVNADLYYGNTVYTMNKDRFDELSPEDQKAVLAAASEAEEWTSPRYTDWIDRKVGDAVMNGGLNARSVSKDDRARMVAQLQDGWWDEVKQDENCGPELGAEVEALFKAYAF
ncbi:TRAP transporter substrate-binding protein DctP [Pikeienuella sp. HZG-20]|uniref:TRAP transporter substrate-binding protein DctP n=1 Tax=Paludibacillus litoralis TaxID=3133267 RepID=UPI0030EB56FD